MHVLLVTAHPEPRSLNGSISRFIIEHLKSRGHQVSVSDLYAMKWKAEVTVDDFGHPPVEKFDPARASGVAYRTGTQAPEIEAEQAKLKACDVLLVQFPLWWYSMPAILKGWFERIYAHGFAYGVGEHSDRRWGIRYGEGAMEGKRAMLIVTTGGWEAHYGPRGVNGPMADLLFPIQHGILFYPGFDVLDPFVVYRASRVDEQDFCEITGRLANRLDSLQLEDVIPFRRQNFGDYTIPELQLRDDLEPGSDGFNIHVER